MGSLGIAVVNIVGWAGFIFAFWMWVEALGVRPERWPAVGWTKTRWFVVWYVSCILTFGLASIALAIYFYRNLRPTLRAGSATTPAGSQLSPPDHQRQVGPAPSKGVVEMVNGAMSCPNCGNTSQQEDRFCRSCGAPIAHTALPPPDTPPDTVEERTPRSLASPDVRKRPLSKPPAKVIVLGALLVVLLVVGLTVALVARAQSDGETSQDDVATAANEPFPSDKIPAGYTGDQATVSDSYPELSSMGYPLCMADAGEMGASDCSGVDLTGWDLSKMGFDGVDFIRSNLTGAKMVDTVFGNANLAGANMSHADLTGADLTGTDLTGADLEGVDFTGAKLCGARLPPTYMYLARC